MLLKEQIPWRINKLESMSDVSNLDTFMTTDCIEDLTFIGKNKEKVKEWAEEYYNVLYKAIEYNNYSYYHEGGWSGY